MATSRRPAPVVIHRDSCCNEAGSAVVKGAGARAWVTRRLRIRGALPRPRRFRWSGRQWASDRCGNVTVSEWPSSPIESRTIHHKHGEQESHSHLNERQLQELTCKFITIAQEGCFLASTAKKEISFVLPICDNAIRLTLRAQLRCHPNNKG
jgi:hypothetical protein